MQISLDIDVPQQKYDVILADPPWRYDFSRSKSRRIENKYDTLVLDQIRGLNVSDFAHNGTVLFLWATAPKTPEAYDVLNAWGFRYVSQFVWDKGKVGKGYWARGQHELLLIGRRPHSNPPQAHARVASVINQDRGEHSRKPEGAHEIVERMFPRAHRIELFARRRRPGWDAWGSEVDCDIDLIVPPGPEDEQLDLAV